MKPDAITQARALTRGDTEELLQNFSELTALLVLVGENAFKSLFEDQREAILLRSLELAGTCEKTVKAMLGVPEASHG